MKRLSLGVWAFIFVWSMSFLGYPLAASQEKVLPELASPQKALISPHGARLEFKEKVEIKHIDAQSVLEFIIPEGANNLHIDASDLPVVRWSMEPVILSSSSQHASLRVRTLEERDKVKARLATVTARLEVWQAQTGQPSSQEMENRQQAMQNEMPALMEQKEKLQRRLNLLDHEIAQVPDNSGIGQKVSVILSSQAKPGNNVEVFYAYDLPQCGWQAIYNFNASPDSGAGEIVEVSMLAEVWQYTGIDWQNTEISLATQGQGPREPRPLMKWVVGAQPNQPVPQPRAASFSAKRDLKANRVMAHGAEEETAVTLADEAPIIADTESVYAKWTLAAKGLPEGRSRVALTHDNWKTPLEWLARPTVNNSHVWLLAKYELPVNQAWPAGEAQFNVNGQNLGSGAFVPKGRQATLYFGSDPRMNVRTIIDSNKQGQTGFISTSKTWTGAWTYIISNEHDRPVKVKVERPAPMLAQDNISVTYKDQPPSIKDDKEHMVYWEVTVPPHGKSTIEHSVTISSPEKLPLLPDVP